MRPARDKLRYYVRLPTKERGLRTLSKPFVTYGVLGEDAGRGRHEQGVETSGEVLLEPSREISFFRVV